MTTPGCPWAEIGRPFVEWLGGLVAAPARPVVPTPALMDGPVIDIEDLQQAAGDETVPEVEVEDDDGEEDAEEPDAEEK